ncbi:uncharacterized protein LOC133711546 [Rosa rugosa]|uniref:uncharacterized protein LOC133711546 n=1 Tax=Rosa rugosa TaxID=74645 RepID=UPI002B403E9D|nr:uncharacterized protein LOC133711546 [Rosa rugosa]
MGFHYEWLKWIMRCVRTVSYSFLINGEPRGKLIPSRGLYQGDSKSPYLFLVCAKGPSRMLKNAEEQQLLHDVSIVASAPPISHLFFADDFFIFMNAESDECTRLRQIFQWYEEASGQQVNFQKSCISFSKNVTLEFQEELAAVLGVERVDKHDEYLGLPTEVSYSKTVAFQFTTEKTRDKMKGWKENVRHSWEGGDDKVCSPIEKGRKIHWSAWDKMCIPKEEGGLGFRNMELFNQDLLAKQGWRLLKYPNSLLARTLKAKYFPEDSFLNALVSPDSDSREWLHEWLDEIFSEDEVELIRKSH